MRVSGFMLVAGVACCVGSLVVGQELLPEEAAAVEEPQLPQLPTEEELKALSVQERETQASAIKRVLLLQLLQFREDAYRMTPGNYMASGYLAIKLKAPLAFAQIQLMLAQETLPARMHRKLVRELDRLYELYRVDPLAIRFFAESELASAEFLSDVAPQLPLESLFYTVDVEKLTHMKLTSDLLAVAEVYAALTAIYAGVTDAESATAAIPQLTELVRRFGKVYPGLILAPQELKNLLSPEYVRRVNPLVPALKAQRERLHEENFYGNAHMKVLDYFFD